MSKRFSKKLFLVIAYTFFISSVHGSTLSEMYTIISKLIENPAQTGEIAPFSKSVGDELAMYIGIGAPARYLEAGGGLGAITWRIVKQMRPCDHLDVVEIDPYMCERLKKYFAHHKNVSIHCCSILDWKSEYQYDAIISTLPFLSLGVDFAQQTMCLFEALSGSGATVSCVEYGIVKTARKIIQGICCNKNTIMRTDVQDYIESVKKKHLKHEKVVYFNLPPVNVYHLNFNV